jgi:hypothetical protein
VSQPVNRCPPIILTLAQGGPLEPLVERGILVPATWDTSREGRPIVHPREALTPNPTRGHVISFYVREWEPPAGVNVTTVMSEFEQDFPLQHFFVDGTRARSQVARYVGLCVDGEPMRRVAEDGNASDVHKTRLIEFMTTQAPTEQWKTFEIPELALQLCSLTSMPLTDLLARSTRAVGDFEPLALRSTRPMFLKSWNRIASEVEACSIHCCHLGSVCINLASYGGLDSRVVLYYNLQ